MTAWGAQLMMVSRKELIKYTAYILLLFSSVTVQAQPNIPQGSSPASPQNPTTEQGPLNASVQRFGDWEVACDVAVPTECSATQRLVAQGTSQIVFAITILPNRDSKQKGGFIGIVSVPLGGYLAPGMQLSVDKGRSYKILFETCNSNGCHAGFPINGQVLASMRSSKAASFKIWTNKTKPVDVSVSLKGLSEALAALISKDK